MDNNRTATVISWIALVFSLVALALGWAAYNRAGTDLTEQVSNQASDETADARRAAARAEARSDLIDVRTRLQANPDYTQANQEINQIEKDLETAYANAEGEAGQEWAELKQSFGTLEQQLRDETADSLQGISNLADRLASDARTDQQ